MLVGCKLDMWTELAMLRELSKQQFIPFTYDQGTVLAKQVGAVSHVECSEYSIRDIFHWPQWPPLAVAIGSYAVLTLETAAICSAGRMGEWEQKQR